MNANQNLFNQAITEILKSTDYMINQSVKNTTKIYDGLIVSADVKGKYNIRFNNVTQAIKQYGKGTPQVGQMVKVYVPQGNFNLAYFILPTVLSSDTPVLSIPIADSTTIGGVKANPKELSDTQLVNIDSAGFLWVAPGKDKNFTFKQRTATNIWSIQHNLEKFPSVTVVDSAGTTVVGEVIYIDNNNLTIMFSSEFAGTAYLN